jgi:hypothetical protein
MKRFALLCAVFCFPLLLQAADNPVDVIQAEKYDKSACIQKKADDCVNLRCTSGPYSSDRDCPEKCQKAAQAQCEVSS